MYIKANDIEFHIFIAPDKRVKPEHVKEDIEFLIANIKFDSCI